MNAVRRLASMDRREVGFRLASEARKLAARAQWMVAPPRWDRTDLNRILSPASQFDSAGLSRARAAARDGDWHTAHGALATHFAKQPSAFPLEARATGRVTDRIRARFPEAPADSAVRAGRILDGRFDLLGYRDLAFGRPPRWHDDPVHGRRAAGGFWAAVPFLDPAHGDHKVIWELNRHQHWLTLGRAYHLTSDPRYYDEFVVQLEHWLEVNPPLAGVNWASMLELGFRSLSWMWALHLFAGAAAAAAAAAPGVRADEKAAAATATDPRPPWTVDLLVGLDRQLTLVEQNLSRYFSPNTHLTGEALALYVSGVTLPELAASSRRRTLGRDVLLQEVGRQILADGGHAERSAHYHRYSTDFYLLAALAARGSRDAEAGRFEDAAFRQAGFLRSLADDRGRLPLIGDDDGGQLFPICGRSPVDCRDTLANAAAILGAPDLAIGDPPEETFWLCAGTLPLDAPPRAAVGWPSTDLPATGYYVSRTRSGDHLIFDAGPHGFLNGGHAHADALSVVLTVEGLPLLVDPGTGTYTMDLAVRNRFRSTPMHNTVAMNGRPQSEPGGPFHWLTAARAHASTWRSAAGADYVEGRHDGYAPQVHARGVLSVHGFGWLVIDHFLGPGEATADAYWHLHPDWSVQVSAHGDASLEHEDTRRHGLASSARLELLGGGDPLGAFAGTYGRIVPAPCLAGRSAGELPRSTLTFIASARFAGHSISIQSLKVALAAPGGWHGAAYKVAVAGFEAILMAAIEPSGEPLSPEAAPNEMWGPAEIKTDARVALLLTSQGRPAEAIVVNGRRLEAPIVELDLDLHTAIARVALVEAQP